ncbi:MAG: hypothetical protein ABIJ96_08135 [Elusimicrobiota bacterium]
MSDMLFKIRMSDRRVPFSPENLGPHAPRRAGVYRLHLLDRRMRAEVLYVGLALAERGQTIHSALAAHIMGNQRPAKSDLLKEGPDIFFDYVLEPQPGASADLMDIAGALISQHRPRLNPSTPPPSSGRYRRVALEEIT